ncbi:hypothetical protein [Sharpea azabuensis]|uniref:hypothetical protein n=1 Tax=Sharpea azabuensis TaxID=322505 RepID=UPI00338D3F70
MLLNTVLKELNIAGIETEMIQLAGNVIEPCKACCPCSVMETVFKARTAFERYLRR